MIQHMERLLQQHKCSSTAQAAARTLTAYFKQSSDGRTHLLFIGNYSASSDADMHSTYELTTWDPDRFSMPATTVVTTAAISATTPRAHVFACFTCPACKQSSSTVEQSAVGGAVSHSTCLGTVLDTAEDHVSPAGELARAIVKYLYPSDTAHLGHDARLRLRVVPLCRDCSLCIYAAARKRLLNSLSRDKRVQAAVLPTSQRLTLDIKR